MALGIGYGLPFLAQHSTNPYKTQWAAAREGAKGAGATVEDENAGAGSCLVSRGQDVYTDGLPSTPSLLIVPQFYKAGNLYQDVPPFVAEDSTMRFTVSRNTTATRVNSSGLIESVASGVPRIDWLGQSCPALLVEASGQNLVPNGVGFNSATGVQTSSVTDSPAAAISGTLCTKNEASGTIRYVSQTFSASALASGTTYTVSRFFKYNGVAFSTTLEANSLTQWGLVAWKQVIVLSAVSGVTLGASSSCTGSIDNFGNGWYRVNVRVTTGAVIGGAATVAILSELPAALSTGEGFLTACPQLEVGSIATTYIPTTVAAVSRAADVISASGALVSGLIGQTEGTMYAEVDLRNWIASGRILTCSNGTSNERIIIQVGANRTLQAIVTTASADVVNISTASGQVNGVYKCALTYASGDFAFYVNGTQIGTDSSGSVPACTSIFLGKVETSASTNFLNDRIRAAALYTTRLSNDQLAELTRL